MKVAILFCALCLPAVLGADSTTPGYAVHGTVTRHYYLYDRDFQLVTPAKDLQVTSTCAYTFFRKGPKWRLDIVRPDRDIPGGVPSTILPIPEGGFISIISFPSRPDDPKSGGNAYVTVRTNTFFPPDETDGAHATWLIFNLEQLSKQYASPKGCPPFWIFDPSRDDLNKDTRTILHTNGACVFWHDGRDVARDAKRNIIFQNGEPKLVHLPAPFDAGFKEAEYRPSPDFLDAPLGIPRSGVLTYWAPIADPGNAGALRMLLLTKYVLKNTVVDLQPISESHFEASWTNHIAVVVDFRALEINNLPLTYFSKSGRLDLSQSNLTREKWKADSMYAAAIHLPPAGQKWLMVLLLTAVSVFTFVICLYFKQSES